MMNKQFLKQAQQMQARLAQAQTEIEQAKVEGSAGGGVVKVVMTGKQVLESVTISPEAAQDVELLQDLILAAVNDASTKVQDMVSKKMGAVTGGMKIPGLM
ncbi:MAG: YbaB/EbfC family nucleoid-associated protein [SAR202 cluster bacterium]|nr:YbaB/EbfC family nucleoid-associated protein [SAR202 cluster bacterium]